MAKNLDSDKKLANENKYGTYKTRNTTKNLDN
jgi:hypothetical protein